MPKAPRGGAASGPEARGGPEGPTVWEPEQPRKTGGPESPECSPVPRSILSPPGLSSSFSASKIRSRPHVSRAPLPAASREPAMTGVARGTLRPAQAPQPSQPAATLSAAGVARHWGRGHRHGAGQAWSGTPTLHNKSFLWPPSLPWEEQSP